jgi:hypothetical protein
MVPLAIIAAGEWAAAIAIVVGALGGFITSIAQLKQGKRVGEKIETVAAATEEVHHLVNDAATKQVARVEQLAGALQVAGVQVPPRPREKPAP